MQNISKKKFDFSNILNIKIDFLLLILAITVEKVKFESF